ncbi:Tripartite ATP-independent periplasmic transporter, DctQ component [Pseudovibrio sp. W64]|uniref:TRAP transporter small permease n=1 Tax=unclassified Pseudovibrio TaxID=2627060 RepID=UPI00070E1788|nr:MULTISPECIES: TRAP transporter small permease [unclassified Pseudovibrio]KZK75906.1 Tripartite ATP-independent periplasmic transporter, DctQ component [Pseudovibrio sp. Ad13]KZK87744.1 Tripartite ATP-independent periplasmic transporter, DctQ component [Pseudovibrio sp. W64]KZK88472.1 Tripartite ATP-independent periplasmic transporter, DctQ component [Pseudovibrio sp. Ad46]KZK90968.1 Tripartite ATP-independent periplasmic transporter, DctQ component [Pseudovibrio sp. Ad5]KZL03665.1 Tripartit
MKLTRALRLGLDGIYKTAGVLSALCLIAILGLIVVQMLARWTGEVFPGAAEYAGYAMAAASFLAFANALNKGIHIRVSILHQMLGKTAQRILEIWCFAIGSATIWYFVYYAYRFVYWSHKFNDISQGQDRTPLWIPQGFMFLGALILAIALTDHLLQLIFTGKHRIAPELEEAVAGE